MDLRSLLYDSNNEGTYIRISREMNTHIVSHDAPRSTALNGDAGFKPRTRSRVIADILLLVPLCLPSCVPASAGKLRRVYYGLAFDDKSTA